MFPFISPTTPSLIDAPAPAGEGQLVEVDEQLFPRRSMVTLADSLSALYALIAPASSPTTEALNEAVVRHGVSGDLCDAVANLAETPDAGEVQISVRWSYVATPPIDPISGLGFTRDMAPLLRETAVRLHDSAAPGDRIVYGYVKSLDRDHDEPEGTVKIKAVIDRRERLFTVVLDRSAYDVAALAHAEDRRVVARGELHRPPGRTWTMNPVSSFTREARMDLPMAQG